MVWLLQKVRALIQKIDVSTHPNCDFNWFHNFSWDDKHETLPTWGCPVGGELPPTILHPSKTNRLPF